MSRVMPREVRLAYLDAQRAIMPSLAQLDRASPSIPNPRTIYWHYARRLSSPDAQ